MNKQLLEEALAFARDHGLTSIEVDGVKFNVPGESVKVLDFVPDMKPEEIIKPMNTLDEMSDEEILYYATPYYDELQTKKKYREEQLKLEEKLRG